MTAPMFHVQRIPIVPRHRNGTKPALTRDTQNAVTRDAVRVLTALSQWAWEELNFRPHAYQSGGRANVENQAAQNQRLTTSRTDPERPRTAPELVAATYPVVSWHQSGPDAARVAFQTAPVPPPSGESNG